VVLAGGGSSGVFSNPKTAKLMTWHADCPEKSDGKPRHPSDAQQWRTFDSKHKEFREEKRNIMFALSTDDMNPFGERSSTHNTWPLLMTIYNLPPGYVTRESSFCLPF
jgi:hypothetical protein